jgi:hypothetical protein
MPWKPSATRASSCKRSVAPSFANAAVWLFDIRGRLVVCEVGVVFCALVATQGCRTPSPDWNGTWKLNSTKGSYQGQVLTISISPDGEYRFDENSSHTLRCDGKDRPIGNNRTGVCVKSGDIVLDITQKENGVKTRATHDELSTDRKVCTTTVTEFRPQHADMTLRLDNLALHIDYPSEEHIDAPLDGVEAAVRGPHTLEGATFVLRPTGNREFLIVTKRQGKVFSQGSLKLSNDGRIITNSRSAS